MEQNHNHQDDATLVALVKGGEREAFGPLLSRYYPSVVRLCRRMLDSELEAQDIAQEAALQAFLGLHRLQEPARFGAWLHAIAANLTRMTLRHQRMLSLDALNEENILTSSREERLPTLEETYVARERSEGILVALNELTPVDREVVIGFYLDGYSYAELAERLAVPMSTIKWRLYTGRRQLRRTLQPLAVERLKLQRQPRKEQGVETSRLTQMQLIHLVYVSSAANYLVVLREIGTYWELPLHVSEAEGEALERVLTSQQPPQPTPYDLLFRLLQSLGAQVQQVIVSKLVEETFYAQIVVRQGKRQVIVDARLAEALVLALQTAASIAVDRSVLTRGGWDPTDAEQQRKRDMEAMQALEAHLTTRQERPSSLPPAPPPEPLAPVVQQQVEACLERVRLDVGGRIALLRHRSGALVAWQGIGNEETLVRWSAAEACQDSDLANFLALAIYPSTEVGGVMLWQVQHDWQLQVALPLEVLYEQIEPLAKDHPRKKEEDRYTQRLKRAVQELEALLPLPTHVEGT
jgi:RNA polymerase sigma-70 factor, ECF subfamily